MEGPRRPRYGRPAATLPVLPHAGRTVLRSAYQAFEPAGQVLPAGRAVHPAPLGYSRVRRSFDRRPPPQWGGTMIPLRCRADPLQKPLSQRVKPAGCPTEARLLRRCQRWGVAGAALDTVAFAEESSHQPPSLVAQAKEMGLQRRQPGKSPNSVRPVKGDWPEPVAQCFAESLSENNGVSRPTGIMFRL